MLKDISIVILDEAHERSQNMDVIIGVLSRLVKLRRKLFEEQLNNLKDKNLQNS